MKIRLVTPAPRGARTGNRVTAERWAAILRQLGHAVSVGTDYRGDRCDLLVAVHARKSHKAIVDYRARVPGGRVVVLLAGTDLYQDGPANPRVRESMEHAARLVVLQPLARLSVPPRLVARVKRPTPTAAAIAFSRPLVTWNETNPPRRTPSATRQICRKNLRSCEVNIRIAPAPDIP
ncbi:MAG: hypothetical protein IIA27_17610 [Gemmatimonadetes bacterium]|nr:hypothetical protein [Gemmatimonadota bacterium]